MSGLYTAGAGLRLSGADRITRSLNTGRNKDCFFLVFDKDGISTSLPTASRNWSRPGGISLHLPGPEWSGKRSFVRDDV